MSDKNDKVPLDEPSEEEFARAGYVPPQGKRLELPFWLAVASCVLALAARTLPWAGLALGILALLALALFKVPRPYVRAPRAAVALSALGILVCAALSTYVPPQPGIIRVSVDAPSWRQEYGAVTISVDGTTESGERVSDSLEVVPGTTSTLDDYQTGSYSFTVDEASLERGEELFEPTEARATCTLELEQDVEVAFELALVPQDGTLGFTVNSEGWDASYGSIPVTVSGTTEDGKAVSETIPAAPETTYSLSGYEAGTYSFSVDKSVLTQGETVFCASSETRTFTKREDMLVTVYVSVDEEATQALAEQRAEEERARAEAEAQARAEAEAAAPAEVEAEARAQEEAQRQQETTEQTVYITDTGEKYHRYGCQYLRESCHPISLSTAQGLGYTPCKRCKP